MMKKQKKYIILILIICSISGLLAQCVKSREPTNEALIQNLEVNKVQYDTIIEMLSEDENVGTIAPDYVYALKRELIVIVDHGEENASDLKITDDRLNEYRKLLKSIGAWSLIRNIRGDVCFGIWGSGFGGNTHHKGIVWIPESSPTATNTAVQLTEIKDGWYIYKD